MTLRIRAIGVAVVVLVVVGSIIAVRRSGDAAARPPAQPADVEAAVADARAFVSEIRGLEWLRDVRVELADDEAFRERLLADAEDDREELEEDQSVLRALKLVSGDVDLYKVLLGFLGDSVIGFYDPETDELVLRGTSMSPYVRSTLVHELVHALDDQHFELHRPALDDAEDESGLAFAAVVEGNAVRVEAAFVDTLTDAERDELDAEERALGETIDITGIPPIVPALIGFPYIFGERFVGTVHAEGGERAVDGALREPPTTSEHILVPGTWLQAQPVLEVPEPATGGEVIDSGTYGQYTLQLTLATELGPQSAGEATAGWGGDAYVAWTEPEGRTCVRAAFAMDTERDLDELVVSLREWANSHGDAKVEGPAEGRVGFVACG